MWSCKSQHHRWLLGGFILFGLRSVISGLFLLTIHAHGQHRERLLFNDLQGYHLNGKVKSVTLLEYEAEYKNDSTFDLVFYDFLAPSNFTLLFNDAGNITEKIEYSADNDTLVQKGHWIFEYNKNRIKREVYIWNNYSKDTTIWEYDYVDKVTTMIDQFDALYKHIRYQYRQQDSLEILTTANGDSSYLSKKIFTYDQWNRVIRIEDYESKTSIQHVRIKKYKAPTLRNPISDTSQKMNPPTTPWILYYTLDSNGNMIETKNREHQVINRIVYTYDENNNWIEKKMINPKGRIYSLYRRKIEYY